MQNKINAEQLAATRASSAYLNPKLQGIAENPISAEERTGTTNATLGGLGASFDALNQNASNRLARTRNTAGYGELTDELARERGRQTSDAEAKLQEYFGQEANKRKMAALEGLAGLRGQDISTVNTGMGIPGQLLNARAAGGKGFGFGLNLGPLSLGGS